MAQAAITQKWCQFKGFVTFLVPPPNLPGYKVLRAGISSPQLQRGLQWECFNSWTGILQVWQVPWTAWVCAFLENIQGQGLLLGAQGRAGMGDGVHVFGILQGKRVSGFQTRVRMLGEKSTVIASSSQGLQQLG